ncbi:MAG: hypothetical protein E7486_05505 [Ruminococcaceae bacterium]|nr:hypothetical protein [Oscillospiraceae bacterium]
MPTNGNAKRIALCGISAALSLLFMFLTWFPFATYALPAIAGLILVVPVIEYNRRVALVAYVAVSILSLLIAPDREAALLFVAFFGYYPILKSLLEKIPSRVAEWVLKMVIFNGAVVAAYAVVIHLFQMADLLEEFNEYGNWGVPVLLAAGNVVFILYDIAATQVISFYLAKWRKLLFKTPTR